MPSGHYTDQGPQSKGACCGLSTAFEMFLIFTTELYLIFALKVHFLTKLTRREYFDRIALNRHSNTPRSSLPVGG